MKSIKHLASILELLSFRSASITGTNRIRFTVLKLFILVPLQIIRQIQTKLC
jgi:hypothetical protein